MVSLDTAAFGPSSQTICRASRAVLARQNVSATTATALSPTGITRFTPGMPATEAASKLFTVPPVTGQSRIAALRRPGSFRSRP